MYDVLVSADVHAFTALLDPDIEWTVPGSHDLAGMFTDVRGSGAPAFEAMSRALCVDTVTEVVVPRLDHLEHVPGFGPADVRLLSRYLHASVVAVEEPVGAGPV